jgi:hypothetical protein
MLAKVTCWPSTLDPSAKLHSNSNSQNSSTYLPYIEQRLGMHAGLQPQLEKRDTARVAHASKRQSGDLQLDIDPLSSSSGASRSSIYKFVRPTPPPILLQRKTPLSSESWAVKGRK